MQTKVLLSIKPEFADKIFSGMKAYEFRRVLFRSKNVTTIVVYASSPVQRVIGEFEVGGILALEKKALWKKTAKKSGIKKAFFDKYFGDRETAYAIKVASPQRYAEPFELVDFCDTSRPPQSFMYLPD
jgi:predicted transcriptional regulator